jgi:hypothetical protein
MQGVPILQAGRLDAWSGHCFRTGRIQQVIMMNDATLFAILLPAKGLTSLDAFLRVFLPKVQRVWHRCGASFDASNQEIIVLKRANRSLVGSMNDAIQTLKFHHEATRDGHSGNSPAKLEARLNQTPYKALRYESPDRLLPRALGSLA